MTERTSRSDPKMIEHSSSVPEQAVERSDTLLFYALMTLGITIFLCLVGIILLTMYGPAESSTKEVLAGVVTTCIGIIGGILSPIGR